MATLEGIRKFFQADRYAMLSGAVIESVGEDTAVCTMEVKDIHLNAGNVVQGGAIFTLADFAFAVAANSGGAFTVSLNNSVSFLRSPRGKLLKAEAKPVSRGKTIAVYEVKVTDELDTLVAVMTVNGFIKGTPLPME